MVPLIDYQERLAESPDALLGSRSVQLLFSHARQSGFPDLPMRASRLDVHRGWRFRPEGREDRIARSLAAIDSPNTIHLDAESWRWIAEDVDVEDIGRA